MERKEKDLIDQLESIGSKTVKLLEKTYESKKPNMLNLLNSVENWLNKKLNSH